LPRRFLYSPPKKIRGWSGNSMAYDGHRRLGRSVDCGVINYASTEIISQHLRKFKGDRLGFRLRLPAM
jgi:hypothetical protein